MCLPKQSHGGLCSQVREVIAFGLPAGPHQLKAAELARHAGDAFTLEVFGGQKVGAGPFEFGGAHRLRSKAFDFFRNGFQGPGCAGGIGFACSCTPAARLLCRM